MMLLSKETANLFQQRKNIVLIQMLYLADSSSSFLQALFMSDYQLLAYFARKLWLSLSCIVDVGEEGWRVSQLLLSCHSEDISSHNDHQHIITVKVEISCRFT